MEENKHFTIDWTNCRLCPRECGADIIVSVIFRS